MELEKLKINSDRPTHTSETGSGKGKQKYFLGWPQVHSIYIVQHVHVSTFVLHVLKISLLHISKITSYWPAWCTTQFVSDHGQNPK